MAAAGDDGAISDEAMALAARTLARAAKAPAPGDISALEAQALSEERGGMSPAEIRALAATALSNAQQISSLMTRLADLLDGPDGHAQDGGSRG